METIPAPLKGKVAIVTGGSRGIGAGIAEKFARDGCTHIAITYQTNKDLAEKTLDTIRSINSSIKTVAIQSNVENPDDGPKVVEQALAGLQTDRIDILVSNAALVGIAMFGLIDDLSHEQFSKIVTGNAWAPFALAQAVIKYMPRGGRIVMMSSGSSKLAIGDPTLSYAAAKAAMDAISKNLGAAWAVKYGVTVNSISVGATDTDALRASFKDAPGFEQLASEISLLKRIGRVQEVADIVAFVASPQASWLCGNQIPANGGGLALLQS